MFPAFRTLASMLAIACAVPAAAQTAPVVHAPAGAVRGERVGELNVFKGLPFALPPTGSRRWKPPVAAKPWKEVRDATAFGAACQQPKSRPGSIYSQPDLPMSEDCLTLNIWAPANAQKAPVLVWIHGGALTTGSSREPTYDGAKLAARGVVLVSINYRLGVLGYLAHPSLSGESLHSVSGNYGLLDQIEALRWVQRNIASFGGDPSNVTISGESAGGLSVMYLMASPPARGLFHKAIAESAYMISTPELRTSRHGDYSSEVLGLALSSKLETDLAGLRAMPAEALVEAAAKVGFFPFGAVDGRILPRQLVDVFDRGEQAKVPLLAGFNSGEIRSLRFLLPPAPADAASYTAAIRERYGDLADEYLRLYPASNVAESMLMAPRDALYGWTSERLALKQTALGAPAYLYYFDHGYPAAEEAGLHGFHAAEIPYVFGTFDRTPPAWPRVPDTPRERTLSDAMASYWVSFAKSGTPAAPGQPDWPAYGTARAYMNFAETPQPAKRLLPGMYELQEQVVCRRRAKGGIPWNWNTGIAAPELPAGVPECR